MGDGGDSRFEVPADLCTDGEGAQYFIHYLKHKAVLAEKQAVELYLRWHQILIGMWRTKHEAQLIDSIHGVLHLVFHRGAITKFQDKTLL